MWNLPGPGIKPVFPALAGGFSTTGPPGEPKNVYKREVLLLHIEGHVLMEERSGRCNLRPRDAGTPRN